MFLFPIFSYKCKLYHKLSFQKKNQDKNCKYLSFCRKRYNIILLHLIQLQIFLSLLISKKSPSNHFKIKITEYFVLN